MDFYRYSNNTRYIFMKTFKQFIEGKYTVNPQVSFIKGSSGKLIKFTHPLDLRSVEDKMSRYPFKR